MAFKKVAQLKASYDKDVTDEEVRKIAREIWARNVLPKNLSKLKTELNEASIRGEVEFGIKPNIPNLQRLFNEYTMICEPDVKGSNRILIPPTFALCLLMKMILYNIDTIDSKGYSSIVALPWGSCPIAGKLYGGESVIDEITDETNAESYLKAFKHSSSSTLFFSSILSSVPDISDSLKDYFLHCSSLQNRITVDRIVNLALSKVYLVRDIK